MSFKTVEGITMDYGEDCLISKTFRKKVDINLFRPVRNVITLLNSYESWKTPEDFCCHFGEIGKGVKNMFMYEKKCKLKLIKNQNLFF